MFLTKKPGLTFALSHARTEFCTYWKFWDPYLLTALTWHIQLGNSKAKQFSTSSKPHNRAKYWITILVESIQPWYTNLNWFFIYFKYVVHLIQQYVTSYFLNVFLKVITLQKKEYYRKQLSLAFLPTHIFWFTLVKKSNLYCENSHNSNNYFIRSSGFSSLHVCLQKCSKDAHGL